VLAQKLSLKAIKSRPQHQSYRSSAASPIAIFSRVSHVTQRQPPLTLSVSALGAWV